MAIALLCLNSYNSFPASALLSCDMHEFGDFINQLLTRSTHPIGTRPFSTGVPEANSGAFNHCSNAGRGPTQKFLNENFTQWQRNNQNPSAHYILCHTRGTPAPEKKLLLKTQNPKQKQITKSLFRLPSPLNQPTLLPICGLSPQQNLDLDLSAHVLLVCFWFRRFRRQLSVFD